MGFFVCFKKVKGHKTKTKKNMEKRVFFTVVLTAMFFGCRDKNNLENRRLLKEYAYCKCLQYASNDSILFKNDISISVYREIAGYSDQAYDKINEFSRLAADNIKPSIIEDYGGKKSILLHCFIYYNSPALDSVIKTLDKEIIPQ